MGFPLYSLLLFLCCLPLTTIADPVKLDVCYDFACKSRESVTLSNEQLQQLDPLFTNNLTADDEKHSIQLAIARLESFAANQLPTGNDVGENYREGMAEQGQQDCIDESTNTTTYLRLLSQRGLLKWHSVEARVYRAPYLIDDHWSALIRDIESQEYYVVDSWFYDNGQAPVIQPLADWKRKRAYKQPPMVN